MVALAMFVAVGVGGTANYIATETARDLTLARLSSVVDGRSTELQLLFSSFANEIVSLAGSRSTQDTFRDLKFGWVKLEEEAGKKLREAYQVDSGDGVSGAEIYDPETGSNYDSTHARSHENFRNFLQVRSYPEMMLIDGSGNIVYTVNKNSEFARNLFDPSYELSNSNLRIAVDSALESEEKGNVFISDVELYGPLGNQAASFMVTPVIDRFGKTMGAIAVALPLDTVSETIGRRSGLGETGEVLIIGDDGLMRSNSVFSTEDDTLVHSFNSTIISDAFETGSSSGFSQDYRNEDLIVQVQKVDLQNLTWAVVAVQSTAEIFVPTEKMRLSMLILGAVFLAVAAVIAVFLSLNISKPITLLTRSMSALADGDLDVEVKGANRKDELADMAHAVEVFRENGVKVVSMTKEQAAATERRNQERAQMMQELQRAFGEVVDAAIAGDFSKRVTDDFPDDELNSLAGSVNNLVNTVERGLDESCEVLAALANADLTKRIEGQYEGAFLELKTNTNAVAEELGGIITKLKATSQSLKAATGNILSGANDLAERTNRQTSTIEETSSTIENLSATVLRNAAEAEDASKGVYQVSRSVEEGGEVMTQANDAMERITQSSSKISNIIGLIDGIAFQTNLLALNASVEAARAGEAGKGFGVVAIEVRRLAQSAADASADVKDLIKQSAEEVGRGSLLVSEAATKLRSALERVQQNSVLMENIARDSRAQASSIEEVSTAVRQIEQMTQHNASLVEQSNSTIEQTEAQASELDQIVDVFRVSEDRPVGFGRDVNENSDADFVARRAV